MLRRNVLADQGDGFGKGLLNSSAPLLSLSLFPFFATLLTRGVLRIGGATSPLLSGELSSLRRGGAASGPDMTDHVVRRDLNAALDPAGNLGADFG